ETELKHYGSLSTHTEIRGLNLCTHLHTREAHSGQHSIELGRKGNTRSRKACANGFLQHAEAWAGRCTHWPVLGVVAGRCPRGCI
ncbi:unnamed protein product, partial [Pylaiella littoralis]